MQHYGWSRAKVYSQLKTVGWSSGRKVRADRGTTTQSMEALAMAIRYATDAKLDGRLNVLTTEAWRRGSKEPAPQMY